MVYSETQAYASFLRAVALVSVLLPYQYAVLAGPLVEVNTSVGTFFLELDDTLAPETTENFLKYVSNGLFDNNFVYGTTNASFVRGGNYTFNSCPDRVGRVEAINSTPIENTNLSNTVGTIAMVRRESGTDYVTSDWAINIVDNTLYDDPQFGYVPFGKVVGFGLEVVETIAHLNPAKNSDDLNAGANDFFSEVINCEIPTKPDFISVKFSLLNIDSQYPTADYSTSSDTLDINLSSNGKFFRIPFDVTTDSDNKIFITAQLESIVELEKPVPNMARFDEVTGVLSVSTVAVDGIILFESLIFSAKDSNIGLFTLESFTKI